MSSSDSSPSSSERESTPPPKKTKAKGKKKAAPGPSGSGKNEGPDPNWEYRPPAGTTLLQDVVDAGAFDWDAVANDDDIELCLIRVPDSIKPKYLQDVSLSRVSSRESTQVATLNRKHATFGIWSVGQEYEGDIGGEEIKALSCLLPRKTQKGKLYPAPKAITRHFVVSAQPVEPTPDPSSAGPIQPYSRPPRQNYPKEALTHVFKPYGSLSSRKASAEDDAMNVDVNEATQTSIPASPKKKKEKHAKATSPEVDKKGKKRKGDVDGVEASPEKKPKKAKTAKS